MERKSVNVIITFETDGKMPDNGVLEDLIYDQMAGALDESNLMVSYVEIVGSLPTDTLQC